MTSARQLTSAPASQKSVFIFSGRDRVFEPVEAIPFAWPTKSQAATEYVKGWLELPLRRRTYSSALELETKS